MAFFRRPRSLSDKGLTDSLLFVSGARWCADLLAFPGPALRQRNTVAERGGRPADRKDRAQSYDYMIEMKAFYSLCKRGQHVWADRYQRLRRSRAKVLSRSTFCPVTACRRSRSSRARRLQWRRSKSCSVLHSYSQVR